MAISYHSSSAHCSSAMFIQMGVWHLFYFGMNILIFTVVAESYAPADHKYEACKPSNCGSGPNISYPFYIYDSGTDFCGYRGFGIFCEQNKPLFRTSKSDYFIQDISYETQSFRLVNQEVVNTSCVAPHDFFQFDTHSIRFTTKLADLILFYNCTKRMPLPYPYPYATVACASTTATNYSVAVLNTGSIDWNSEKMVEEMACERYVGAPVDWEGGRQYKYNQTVEAIDYIGLLKNGFSLEWTGINCSKCQSSGGRCGFDENNNAICFCPDRPHTTHCNNGNNKPLRIALGLAIPVIGLGILLALTFYLRRKFRSIFCDEQTRKHLNVEAFLRNHAPLPLKRYHYSEVKKMTNSFKDKLGEGGHGIVYKGKLLNGDLVAVKVLSETKGNGEEFINEIATISRTSHVNIVSLLGFCFHGSKRALIYEFMPNGSLEKFLYDNNSSRTDENLGWETLYNIAIGIARGLEYLHRGCNARILHFDIKPHNVLLNQDFCPKISDFGLSKICTQKESIISMSCARGTIGYIAPEVFCRNFGDVSPKSDVYSYGMMVLEMVGGKKNIGAGADHTSEIYFPHWIYKRLELDEGLELQGFANEEDRMRARMMIIVSLWCIQTNPSNRPSMSQVVDMLEGSLESLQIPPKPFLYSPPRSSMGDSSTAKT